MSVKLPKLYKRTSKGGIQTWYIETKDNTIITTYGLLDGKKQTARDVIETGKNIGRSNETTPTEQAMAEAKAQWDGKIKKGYVQSLDDAVDGKVDEDVITGGITPMLAHSYQKQGHKIIYPAAVQPKLDGHRCIAVIKDGKATLWSRTRKPIVSMPHIVAELEYRFAGYKDMVLDGELYNHEYRDRFEQLTSFIRPEYAKEGCEIVQYHVYDAPMNEVFALRISRAMMHLTKADSIKIVPTHEVDNEEELMDRFAEFRAEGYEGLIVRNLGSVYENKRSYHLQKVKTFDDSEFKIVGVVQGRGKLTEMGMFVCETEDGQQFEVKMVGELELLKQYLAEPDKYIGKTLTVQHQGVSTYGIPRFGVGLRLREDI